MELDRELNEKSITCSVAKYNIPNWVTAVDLPTGYVEENNSKDISSINRYTGELLLDEVLLVTITAQDISKMVDVACWSSCGESVYWFNSIQWDEVRAKKNRFVSVYKHFFMAGHNTIIDFLVTFVCSVLGIAANVYIPHLGALPLAVATLFAFRLYFYRRQLRKVAADIHQTISDVCTSEWSSHYSRKVQDISVSQNQILVVRSRLVVLVQTIDQMGTNSQRVWKTSHLMMTRSNYFNAAGQVSTLYKISAVVTALAYIGAIVGIVFIKKRNVAL